jgi:hypothetical protein
MRKVNLQSRFFHEYVCVRFEKIKVYKNRRCVRITTTGLKCRDRFRSSNYHEMSGYSNYIMKSEMKGIDVTHVEQAINY